MLENAKIVNWLGFGRNRKTGIGLENDRNAATMGYISAAFVNDTVSVFLH
jgi:hypothetical protein